MEAPGGQRTTLASQRLHLALREADSEVTMGAWVKPGLWGHHREVCPVATVGPNSWGASVFLGGPSLCKVSFPPTLI